MFTTRLATGFTPDDSYNEECETDGDGFYRFQKHENHSTWASDLIDRRLLSRLPLFQDMPPPLFPVLSPSTEHSKYDYQHLRRNPPTRLASVPSGDAKDLTLRPIISSAFLRFVIVPDYFLYPVNIKPPPHPCDYRTDCQPKNVMVPLSVQQNGLDLAIIMHACAGITPITTSMLFDDMVSMMMKDQEEPGEDENTSGTNNHNSNINNPHVKKSTEDALGIQCDLIALSLHAVSTLLQSTSISVPTSITLKNDGTGTLNVADRLNMEISWACVLVVEPINYTLSSHAANICVLFVDFDSATSTTQPIIRNVHVMTVATSHEINQLWDVLLALHPNFVEICIGVVTISSSKSEKHSDIFASTVVRELSNELKRRSPNSFPNPVVTTSSSPSCTFPILPAQIQQTKEILVELMDRFSITLLKTKTFPSIDDIKIECSKLLSSIPTELRKNETKLEKITWPLFFKQWEPYRLQYPKLFKFCCGLATAMIPYQSDTDVDAVNVTCLALTDENALYSYYTKDRSTEVETKVDQHSLQKATDVVLHIRQYVKLHPVLLRLVNAANTDDTINLDVISTD